MTTAKQEEATTASPPVPVPEDVPIGVSRKVVDENKDGKADKGTTSTVQVFEVVIERSNNEKVATEVMAYELPILKRLHGESRVAVDEDEPAFEVEVDADAHSILKMLQGKYGENLVNTIYRDVDEFADKAGIYKAKKAKGKVESENTDARKKSK